MILTDEQQVAYDSWTKMQIFEAYLLEVKARTELNTQLNKVNRKLAEIKFIAGGR